MAISKKHKKNVCNKKNHTRRIRKRKYKRKRKNKRTFRKSRYINLSNKTLKQKGGVGRPEEKIKQDIKNLKSDLLKIRRNKSALLVKGRESKDRKRKINLKKRHGIAAKEEGKIEGKVERARNTSQKLLKLKFGDKAIKYETVIDLLSLEKLDIIEERILMCDTVESIFKGLL